MKYASSRPPLLLETVSKWLTDAFQANKVPFLSSLLWGLLAYTFAFTNKLVNHDEVGQLFGKGATISSGRWGLAVLDRIFPNYSMPWIYGILTLVMFAVSVCLIIRIFSIQNKTLQVLLAGSIMVFPSLIGLFGYMFTSSSYALSFLLAVLAVWFLCQKSRLAVFPAVGCLVLSVSIYQSYISVAASLLVLILIRQLLTGQEPAAVLKRGIGYVVFLVLSLAIYYASTQVVFAMKNVSFNEYATNNISFSLSYLLQGIRLAYLNFARFFYWAHHRLMPTSLSRKLHFLLFLCIAVMLVIRSVRQKQHSAARYGLLLFLVLILPLAINCMYLITSEASIHTLVLYSFVAVYILAVFLADLLMDDASSSKAAELLRRIAIDAAAIAITVIIVINAYVANAAYLNMYLRYENAYSFFTSLSAQIQQMPEFQEGTRLAVIGTWDFLDFYENNMEFTYYLTGVGGFMPTTYTAQDFMKYYIGCPVEFASAEEVESIRQTEAFQNMSLYPYYGSTSVIDDIIVVKLSE